MDIKTRLGLFLGTGFMSGYFPIAPGTVGTAVAIPLVYASSLILYPWVYVAAGLFFFFIGVWASDIGEKHFGKKDPGQINIDEIAGYYVTMLYVPLTPATLIIGFFVFRAADIIKPPPVRSFEKIRGGWGIMLDDVFAGLYSLILMQLIVRIIFKEYLL